MLGIAKRIQEDGVPRKIVNTSLRCRRLILYFSCAVLLAVTVAAAAPAPPQRIAKADVKHVCMIHNKAYPNVQKPVVLNGHTYYVYCDLCKAKLTKNAPLRYAIDPISGKRVDKATAVVGVKPSGELLYFESAATFAKYAAGK